MIEREGFGLARNDAFVCLLKSCLYQRNVDHDWFHFFYLKKSIIFYIESYFSSFKCNFVP